MYAHRTPSSVLTARRTGRPVAHTSAVSHRSAARINHLVGIGLPEIQYSDIQFTCAAWTAVVCQIIVILGRRTPHAHNGGHAVSPRRVQASYTGTKPPRDRRVLRAFRNDRTSLNDHLAHADCDEHNGGSQLRPAARETAVTDVSQKLVHTDRHDPAAKTAAVCEGSSEYDSRGRLNRSDVSAPRGDSASADRSPGCRVAADVDRAPMRTDSPRRETVVRTRLTFLCV